MDVHIIVFKKNTFLFQKKKKFLHPVDNEHFFIQFKFIIVLFPYTSFITFIL